MTEGLAPSRECALIPGEPVAPVRVKLSRAKGWRMPANTVRVARPGRWGNPFNLADSSHCWTAIACGFKGDKEGRRAASVELYRRWLKAGAPSGVQCGFYADAEPIVEAPAITAGPPPTVAEIREHLAGKNLACWCPIDGQPCHADVLLELANAPDSVGMEAREAGRNAPQTQGASRE